MESVTYSMFAFPQQIHAPAEILGCLAVEFGPRQRQVVPFKQGIKVHSFLDGHRSIYYLEGKLRVYRLLICKQPRVSSNHISPPKNPGPNPSRAGEARRELGTCSGESCAVAVDGFPRELVVAIGKNPFSLFGSRGSPALVPRFDGAGTYFPSLTAVFVCLCSCFAL